MTKRFAILYIFSALKWQGGSSTYKLVYILGEIRIYSILRACENKFFKEKTSKMHITQGDINREKTNENFFPRKSQKNKLVNLTVQIT
jgi:hypothetical protein